MTDEKKLPDRSSPFWEASFLRGYEHVLSHLEKDEHVLPMHAAMAVRMADQCVRARDDFGSAVCGDCVGVGCASCQWTGKAAHAHVVVHPGMFDPAPPEGSGVADLALGHPLGRAVRAIERGDLRIVPGAAVETTTELDSDRPPPPTGR